MQVPYYGPPLSPPPHSFPITSPPPHSFPIATPPQTNNLWSAPLGRWNSLLPMVSWMLPQPSAWSLYQGGGGGGGGWGGHKCFNHTIMTTMLYPFPSPLPPSLPHVSSLSHPPPSCPPSLPRSCLPPSLSQHSLVPPTLPHISPSLTSPPPSLIPPSHPSLMSPSTLLIPLRWDCGEKLISH